MRINFGDLAIGDIAKKYLQSVLDKNWASEGDNVKEFEERFAGRFGYKGKRFKVKYETMFENIAPGSYRYYRMLCDMAHGAIAAQTLKIDVMDRNQKRVFLDKGVVFKAKGSSFVLNQFSVFLLGHIEFMMLVYPEIKRKMPEFYAAKYHKTLSKLWAVMNGFAESKQNKKWSGVVKQLVG